MVFVFFGGLVCVFVRRAQKGNVNLPVPSKCLMTTSHDELTDGLCDKSGIYGIRVRILLLIFIDIKCLSFGSDF